MIQYTVATTISDLNGILSLQKSNLIDRLSQEERRSQGFVTVSHTLEQLKDLNEIEPHIIAKDGESVVAYLLAMTKRSSAAIPVLLPMFNAFEKIMFRGKSISDLNYMVIGQACVNKDYRGQGIFDAIYQAYRDRFRHNYDFAITEIASINTRSLAAHRRVGFRDLERYQSPDGVEWCIVIWEW